MAPKRKARGNATLETNATSPKKHAAMTSGLTAVSESAQVAFANPSDGPEGYQKYCDSVLVHVPENAQVSDSFDGKVASFDLDWTLIRTKKGNTFPKNKDDWQLWNPAVKEKMEKLRDDGQVIVLFSNQSRIGMGKAYPEDIAEKIHDVLTELGIEKETWVFLSTEKRGSFRKPSIGMWELFEYLFEKENPTAHIDVSNSAYIGDAAGRPAVKGIKKDFHNSDLRFAINVGLKFHTPEAFFLGSTDGRDVDLPKRGHPDLGFDPLTYLNASNAASTSVEAAVPVTKGCELVICVGPPAAGKSAFAAHHFPNYVIANQDTLKTAAKVVNCVKDSLKAGKSVILDNTHRTADNRAKFIAIAQKLDIPVRCFFFPRTKEEVLHLNEWRTITPYREQRHIPGIAIHSYFKNLEMPTIDEGFESVHHVPFVFRESEFHHEGDKRLFTSFLT